jgi:hypothetical protein
MSDTKPASPVAAASAPSPATAKKFKYQIKRSLWDADGNRMPDDVPLELTAEQAQDWVESGAVERIKDA